MTHRFFYLFTYLSIIIINFWGAYIGRATLIPIFAATFTPFYKYKHGDGMVYWEELEF
jgi:hypothetical protein